jgi:recombinational DNA repair protein (RecF pathway)
MQPKRDLAIVLRSVPYEDRHRIVTALTEHHGQISALARNSIQSRRFGGTLDPFVASEWQFAEKPGAELARLDEALIKRSFEGIRKDFERLSLASVFSEFMLRVAPKNEACTDLFKLHSNALVILEELPGPGSVLVNSSTNLGSADAISVTHEQFLRSILVLLNGYLTKCLQWSGNQPQLQACHSCKRSLDTLEPNASLTCLILDAAWICPDCRTNQTHHIRDRGAQGFQAAQIRVTPMAIIDFLMSLVSPIRQIPTHAQASREEHAQLFQFIEALFAYHLPGFDQKPLNGLRFLGLESNLQPR